jgi:hypothetical protein
MKKLLFSMVTISILIVAFAFTKKQQTLNKPFNTYYWFEVDPGAGDQSDFIDDEVLFKSGPSMSPPSLCDELNNYKCIIGFSADQVTFSGGTYHISNSARQSPATNLGRYRSTE